MPPQTSKSAGSVLPLRLEITDRAKAEAKQIYDWLEGLPFGGQEAADKWNETIKRVLPQLCQDIAERFASGSNLPRPDEEASLAFARPALMKRPVPGS